MLRVLLVDDELRILTDIEKHVPWKMLGISHIFKARSVREALDIFHKYTPEIIISDIEMSGQTGIDLLHAIRKENADTKFLFLTCHSEFDYMQNAIRLGSCDYLLKPINYDELTSTLQNLINNYEKNSFQQAEHSVIHGDSDMIEHAKQYIADHFIEEIKISDIAGHLHCSEPYVMKIFKKNTGYSILEYITNQRMNKACELLKNTDWNISFIAYMCGYDDNSYFTRVFKKVVGISPTTYRKKERGEL